MKTIKHDLILKKDTTFNENINVEGSIKGDFNLKVIGNIDCGNIDCWNIDCLNIDCRNIDCKNVVCGNIDCWNIDCRNIDCWNINCRNIGCGNIDCWNIDCLNIDCKNVVCGDINCGDINFYAIAIAYNSFKCKSWKARRNNHMIKCLDGEIEIKDKPKICDKCGSEIK